MENVQQHFCINVPSSQTFRSYLDLFVGWYPNIVNSQMEKRADTVKCRQSYVTVACWIIQRIYF
jgi:hypothetical protein